MIVLPNGSPVLTSAGASIEPAEERAAADLYIVTVGDSMTRDRGDAAYGNQLKAMILAERGEVAYLEKRGVNGISWDYRWEGDPFPDTLIEHGPKIDALRQTSKPHWLIAYAGSNGLGLAGNSAATEYANFKTYIAARIAAGQPANRIVAVPTTARDSIAEPVRVAYNAAMVGDDDDLGYLVARSDLDPDIGAAGANADTDWFYDGLHLNNAGHARLAQIIYDTMFPA